MNIFTRRMPFYLNVDETGGGGEQAPSEDTPDISAESAASQPTQDTNWEERYKNLQADHTRKAQEAAEYRRLVEGARQGNPEAIEALGLALAEQEDEAAGDEPQYLTRQEWEQHQAAQAAEREQEQRIAEIETHVERELNGLNVADEELRDWLVSRAIALEPTEAGMPDIQKAWQQFEALMNAQKKGWAKSKRAPHVSQAGQAGTQTPDLDNREERQAYMLARYQEGQQQ